jgi:hypothetical protein
MTDSIDVRMLDCLRSGDVRGAVSAAEAFETGSQQQPILHLPPRFFPLLAASYMVTGDLCGARFALKRSAAALEGGPGTSSDNIANSKMLQGLQRVLQCLWGHDYPTALSVVDSIENLDPVTALLRDAIVVRAVRRAAASSGPRESFSVASCVDVQALKTSAEAVENLIARAGGLDEVLRRDKSSTGWDSASRINCLQRIAQDLQ